MKTIPLIILIFACAAQAFAQPPPRRGRTFDRPPPPPREHRPADRGRDKPDKVGGILHAVGATIGLIDHVINKPQPVIVNAQVPVAVAAPVVVTPTAPTPTLVVAQPQMYDGLELVIVPAVYAPPPRHPAHVIAVPAMPPPHRW